jgi:hypothetical protein
VRGQDGVIVVAWTRAELAAVREAIEITPLFEGRAEARDIVRSALRAPRVGAVTLEGAIAARLAAKLVPVDTPTATARAKLQRAVRSAPRPGA